jgi:hypothetical protein
VLAAGDVATAAAWNVLTNDVIDHESRIKVPGMVLLTPTSVTGGTFSGGKITLAASSSAIINGVFTSAYDNYRIVYSNVTSTTAALWYLRLALSGTPTSASSYSYGINQISGAGLFGNLDFSAASDAIAIGQKSNTQNGGTNVEIHNPAIAVATNFSIAGNYGGIATLGGGYHSVATAFDGFQVLPNGSISCTIRVYGYQPT